MDEPLSLFSGSDANLKKKTEEWFKDAQKAQRRWRRAAVEAYDYYAGDQWSEADRQHLIQNDRPIVTFNRVAPTIDSVTGFERSNRQEVQYIPRTLDDGSVTEMFTEAARWIRDLTDAEDEESEAFQDNLITGMGWTETWLDMEEDDGLIKIDRIPALEMYWDPSANKRNLSDARYVMRVRTLSREEIKERWPDSKLRLDGSFFQPDIVRNPHDQEQAKFYIEDQGIEVNPDDIPVAQVQWWERRPVFLTTNPEDGSREVLTKEEFDFLKEDGLADEAVRFTEKRFFQAFIAGRTVLEKSELHGGDIPGFTLRPITGKRDETDGVWYGIMRSMKDPQNWSNKFFSQIMDIVNSNAKGGIIAEKGVFSDIRDAEEKWAKTDSIIEVEAGALSGTGKKILERGQAEFPSALDRLMQVAMGAVRDTSGVNVELLGLAERTQAGIVEASRIRQGLLTLGIYFDSLRRYRKEQGRVLLHFINRYLPDNELIRIAGQDKFVQFSKDPNVKKYDVIVDQAPSSPNTKQEVWQIFQQIFPAMIKAGIPIPPDVVDFLPMPQSVINRFKKFFAQQGPSELEQKAQQEALVLAIRQAAADVKETEAGAVEKLAKAVSNIKARENDFDKNQIAALKVLVEAFQEEKDGRGNSKDANG